MEDKFFQPHVQLAGAIGDDFLPAGWPAVIVRKRPFVVMEIVPSVVGGRDVKGGSTNLVSLSSVEDDGLGEELQVVWELEPGATIQQQTARDRLARSRPDRHGFLAPNSVCNNRSTRGIISEAARRVRIKRVADLSLRRTAFRPGSERMGKTGVTLSARVLPSQSLRVERQNSPGRRVQCSVVCTENSIRIDCVTESPSSSAASSR